MRSVTKSTLWFVAASGLMLGSSLAWGATYVISFDTPQYGQADWACINNPSPPLFNRPEYGTQTSGYIVDPPGCGQGTYDGSNGSDSLLTQFYKTTGANSNELRFSWTDPTDNNTWARVPTFENSGGTVKPLVRNPVVHLGVGSSISMDIAIFGTTGVAPEAEVTDGQLEFSLAIRETGANLPLGADGGTTGLVEFVGVTGKGGPTDANTPVGGVPLNHSSFSAFTTVKWTFVDTDDDDEVDAVEVSLDGGAPQVLGFAGLSGNGVLKAAYDRGTLDSLVIRKPVADTTTKKWYVNIDNIVIDAPGHMDPVAIEGPVFAYKTEVTVKNISEDATQVTLYRNGAEVLGVAYAPFTELRHTFTGLTMAEGQVLTATQTIDDVESDASAPMTVLSAVIMREDFDAYASQSAFNSVWRVTGTTTEPERITLDSSTAATCPKAALEPASAGGSTAFRAQAYRNLPGAKEAKGFQGSDAEPLVLTVWALHSAGTQNRNWIQLMSHSGNEFNSGSRRSWIRMGMYNSPPAVTSLYQCSVSTGFVVPDPSYHNLDEGPDGATAVRQPGQWVKWRIRVKSSTVEFLVNDVLYKVLARPNGTDTFDSVLLGSGYTNSGNPAWYDNMTLSIGDEDPFPTPVPQPNVPTLLQAPASSVLVTNVSPQATNVKVFANGAQVGSVAVSNVTQVNVPVSPAIGEAQLVQAKQTINGLESCLSYSRVTAFAQGVGNLRVVLGVREQPNISGPVGATVTAAASGQIEWIGHTTTSAPPRGKLITPGANWQEITFWPQSHGGTDPVTAAYTVSGDGQLTSAALPWVVLEHIGIAIDYQDPKPGPYALYIDSIENDGVVFGGFEGAPIDSQRIFWQPSFSGSTSSHIAPSPAPNFARVKAEYAYAGTQANKVEWQFTNNTTSRWIRLTTSGTDVTTQRSPQIRIDKPVTIRFLLCGAQAVSVGGPLVASDTTVTVTGVSTTANQVKVFVNGTLAGTAPGNGTDRVIVQVPALLEGQTVTAVQSVGGVEGCPGGAAVVGSGQPAGGLRIALGVREPASPSGQDLEWVGASGSTNLRPSPTQVIHPSPTWQTLTWDASSPVQAANGDGVVQAGDPGGTPDDLRIDSLGIIRQAGNTDTGPYVLYIDSITNGETMIQDWEAATLNSTFFFQQPSYSGTTNSFLLFPPNIAVVTNEKAAGGSKSKKVNWQWRDGNSTSWLRLVTTGTALPAITIDWTKPVTMKFLYLGAFNCNAIWADGDGDGDVDMDDFAAFQRCLTIGGASILPECICFDQAPPIGTIDADDLTAFHNCASGADVPADPNCSN